MQDVTTDKLREYFSSYGIIADAVAWFDWSRSRHSGFVQTTSLSKEGG